jgi:sulfur-carrier protein
MLQPLTGGVSQMRVAGRTIRAIINHLEERFPGMKERLLQDGALRPDVVIAIDGETALDGLAELVGEDSEVHFIPPISGGETRAGFSRLSVPGLDA